MTLPSGWYHTAPEKERDFCRRYLARSGEDIAWDMIRVVWSSAATFTLAPMQDFLSLGTEARMNLPGRPGGNWTWRVDPVINFRRVDRPDPRNQLSLQPRGWPGMARTRQGALNSAQKRKIWSVRNTLELINRLLRISRLRWFTVADWLRDAR